MDDFGAVGGGLTAKQRARREQVRFEAVELSAQDVGPPQVAPLLQVSYKFAYVWRAGGGAGAVPERVVRAAVAHAAAMAGPAGRGAGQRPCGALLER